MKKILPLLTIIMLALSINSCDSSLKKLEEGNINYFIYPYLKFTLSLDRTYYIASVVTGAKLTTVFVPGFVHTDFGAMPVREFSGFDNNNDSILLEEVIIDVNIDNIWEDAFDKAENIKVVKVSGDKKNRKWAHLPTLEKEGYHFLGWKAGDTYVFNGMAIDPENTEAVPVWAELVHHDAKEADCTSVGNIEYWECKDCGKLFTDSYAQNTVNSVSLQAIGHLYPLVWVSSNEATCQKKGNIGYYRCDRCGGAFSDEAGNNPVANVDIPKLDYHVSDGILHTNETHHWYQCQWCGTEIDKNEHGWGGWIVTIHATEHTKGAKYHDCLTCGYRETVDIPEHDHIEGEILEKHEATCTEGAYYIEKCGNPDCGEIVRFEIESKPALGHAGYIVPFEDSTCVKTGTLLHFHCTRCNLNFENQSSVNPLNSVVLPMKDHVWSTKWSESETEHYHLCINCKTARNDVAPHVYDREVADSKYLVSSSTCQYANIYRKSCLCGRAGEETFSSGVVGDHSYTKYVPVDYLYHQQVCQWCGAVKPDSKEKHEFDEHKVCIKCKYVPVTSEGGFDVIIVDKTPKGHIELASDAGTKKTFVFVNEKSAYPPTKLEWSVEGVLKRTDNVTGVTNYSEYSFTVSTPFPMTYRVMCRYSNESAYGSSTIVVIGGEHT